MLPTICISFGGTHLSVGLLDDEQGYVSTGTVNWRAQTNEWSPATDARALLAITVASLARLTSRILKYPAKDYNVGVAFPGPFDNGLWFSNNLTDDFRDGLPLEQLLRCAIRAAQLSAPANLVVTLDAQADAGGELHHQAGALWRAEPGTGACVINVATGIAAGFICPAGQGRSSCFVARSEEDFNRLTGGRFDAGAGQLGRHLFAVRGGQFWQYCYEPGGRVRSAISGHRLSDYLSGPAVAARFSLRLAALGDDIPTDDGVVASIEFARKLLDGRSPTADSLAEMTRFLRASVAPAVRNLITAAGVWSGGSEARRRMLSDFRTEIADDWAGALRAWQEVEGWGRVNRSIVLTGGVGQNLFRAADPSFIRRIASGLLDGTRLTRSILEDGCERATWFFHKEVFG